MERSFILRNKSRDSVARTCSSSSIIRGSPMHRRFRIHVHFSKGMMRARGMAGEVVLISDLVATDVVGRKLSRGLSPPLFLPSSLVSTLSPGYRRANPPSRPHFRRILR